MTNTADVVVIGAGIQGLSAAYHLARMGAGRVIVLEKDVIGAGSSGRSASMLMKQVWNEDQIRLAVYSFERYMAFSEETGGDTEYRPIGTLQVVTEVQEDDLRQQAALRRDYGIETYILSPDEIKKMVPVLNVDDLAVGTFGAEDGVIEAQSIMLGYADAARWQGAAIWQGIAATGIDISVGQVTAVQTTDGPIATEWVVNAAGADAAKIGRWAGIELPIDNRARSVYVTGPFPKIPNDVPFVYDESAEWYFRREGPGVLMGMGKERSDQPVMAINWRLLPAVIDVAMHRVPVLAEASIASGWTGIRPLTPDGRPIIGPADGVEGYVNSVGWGGEGVMLAPAGGQLVAEVITQGQATTFDLAPFLLSRFEADGIS